MEKRGSLTINGTQLERVDGANGTTPIPQRLLRIADNNALILLRSQTIVGLNGDSFYWKPADLRNIHIFHVGVHPDWVHGGILK